jgi:hypothetical protein
MNNKRNRYPQRYKTYECPCGCGCHAQYWGTGGLNKGERFALVVEDSKQKHIDKFCLCIATVEEINKHPSNYRRFNKISLREWFAIWKPESEHDRWETAQMHRDLIAINGTNRDATVRQRIESEFDPTKSVSYIDLVSTLVHPIKRITLKE